MFKSALPSILYNKSRTIIAKKSGSETERLLSSMIYDDDVNVLTTFDMNRVASYTFGETICGEIFDLLEKTIRTPQDYSVLSLHKVLVLMHHLSIYASQKAANAVWILKPHIKPLLEYNTVLIAHKDPKSLVSRMQRIKGGSVDRGQPVREAAKVLYDLLSDVELFRTVRANSADPDSLVPVGHHEEVGFVSDHVKKAMLLEKMQAQHKVDIKSNLKESGGFGAGAGSHIIGAAHSMEEMLKMAMKDNIGYRDGDLSESEKDHYQHIQTLKNELQMKKVSGLAEDGSGTNNGNAVTDLLDFGDDGEGKKYVPESGPLATKKSIDYLPYTANNEDPFVMSSADDKEDVFGTLADDPSAAAPVLDGFTSTSMQNNANISHEMDLLSIATNGMGFQTNVSSIAANKRETSFHNQLSPFDHNVAEKTESELLTAPGQDQIKISGMGAINDTQSDFLSFVNLSDSQSTPAPTNPPQSNLPHQDPFSELPLVPSPFDQPTPLPPVVPSMPSSSAPVPPPPTYEETVGNGFQSVSQEKKHIHDTYLNDLKPFSR